MHLELLTDSYDVAGKGTFRPDLKRKAFHPTFPFGRYFSRPLQVQCKDLEEIRKFLQNCEPASDKELFDKSDYWQPPDEFERRRRGDCEDFALWTWRQLIAIGYRARFVVGRYGRYREGHAWVMFETEGKWFLLEPSFRRFTGQLPALSTLQYHPSYSVEWDGTKAHFYSHQKTQLRAPFPTLAILVLDWAIFWTFMCANLILHFPSLVAYLWKRR
jgi:hypothetical protein